MTTSSSADYIEKVKTEHAAVCGGESGMLNRAKLIEGRAIREE